MSYDISFIPKRPEQSWAEAVDAHEQIVVAEEDLHPLDEATRARYGGLIRRVQGLFPHMEFSETPGCLELSDPDNGIQLHLYAIEVGLSVPYWHEAEADKVVSQLESIARIVEEETGWQGYDPQQDRAFLCEKGASDAASEMRRITGMLHRTRDGGGGKRPWWRFW